MKFLRTLSMSTILTLVLAMSVMAGETSSPPCAPPEGGETSSPPCVASEILPGDANGNQAINNTQAPGTESINQIAFDLLQTLLTIF